MLRSSGPKVISLFRKHGMSVAACALIPLGMVACGQDPAFTEKTSYLEPSVSVDKKSGDAQAGQGAEINAGKEQVKERSEMSPDGEAVASAPGIDPNGPRTGVGEGSGTNSGVVPGTDGTRPGVGETPVKPPVVVVLPTPVATQPPGTHNPKAGAAVVFNTQQREGKVDILWIVDSSGSMDWAQNQLQKQFESFASALSSAKVDFRVAATSLDVCDIDWSSGKPKPNEYCPISDTISPGKMMNGLMVGPAQGRFVQDPGSQKSVLTRGPDFVESFTRMAKMGTSGSSLEHGLTAARMAIEKAKSGVNAGFLRSDAYLSVVVLSDEEDDGVQMSCEDGFGNTTLNANGQKDLEACKKGGTSPYLDAFGVAPFAVTLNSKTNKNFTNYKYTPDMFKQFLDKSDIKGPGKASVSAITGLKDAQGNIVCNNPDIGDKGPKEAGTAYIRAAQLTGGVVENICNNQWDKLLSNVGKNVGELANQIALPSGKIPFAGTLEVIVDGVNWAASDFSYKADGNFLVFKKTPASGVSIQVKYKETTY
jgi:hypothetical protein